VLRRGLSWSLVGLAASRALAMGARILLAGLLWPEHFGLFGMIAVGLGLLSSVSDMGLQTALLQRRGRGKHRLASSVLWSLGALGLGLWALWALVGAPVLGWAYADARLVAPAQVMGALLLIIGLSAAPTAVLIRQRRFDILAIAEFGGVAAGAAIALVLARQGAGVWSLVAQQVAGAALTGLLTWGLSRWQPGLGVDAAALRRLQPFGRAIAGTRLVLFLRTNLDQFFIGVLLGPATLGVYMIAFTFTETLRAQVGLAISRVLLPLYSQRQDDPVVLRNHYLRATRLMPLLLAPMSLAVMLYAETLCNHVLGSAWADAASPMRVLALAGLLHAAGGPAAEVLQGMGRAQLLLGVAVRHLLLIALPSMALFTWWQGVMGAAWAYAIAVIAQRLAMHRVLRDAIGVGASDVWRASGPPIALAALTLLVGSVLRGRVAIELEACLLAVAWVVIGHKLARTP
jgi:teichuronic acid exporter